MTVEKGLFQPPFPCVRAGVHAQEVAYCTYASYGLTEAAYVATRGFGLSGASAARKPGSAAVNRG